MESSQLTNENIQDKLSNLNQQPNNLKVPQQTEGGGDCAFHAIFGKWNGNQFVCSDVRSKREQLADAIRKSKLGDPIFKLVQEGIKAIIMECRSTQGEYINELKKRYSNYVKVNQTQISRYWQAFVIELKKYSEIISYIEKTSSKKQKKATLKEKFYDSLANDTDGTLIGLLLSVPKLDTMYKSYNQKSTQDFWESTDFSNKNILEEYANFIKQDSQWLLPLELNILAYVFDIKINFYTTNFSTKERQLVDSYNPKEKNNEASVNFNGVNHYECMEDPQKLISQYSNANETLKNSNDIHDFKLLDSKLSELGYLTNLKLTGRPVKNLNGFEWNNIPMLAVITGINGIGKTAVLEAILQGFERKINYQEQFHVDTKFKSNKIPQIFSFSSSGSTRSTHEQSLKNHTNDFNQIFEDFKKYDFANRYVRKYQLKFPDLKNIYDKVITTYLEKSDLDITDQNNYQYIIYEELKLILTEELGIHISTYGSLEKYFQYLLERGITLDVLNSHLKKKGFKYLFSEKCLDRGTSREFPLEFIREGTKEDVHISWFSPGERLELLALLWTFESNAIKRNKEGAIILLDELDAHLHPSLAREVMQVIKQKLVGEYGIQVIMTTHSPTTVSLAPKDCLFFMSENTSNKRIQIEKAISKKHAIQLLASDFVYVNEPFRFIFVEAENDKKFYQLVRERLIDLNIIKPNEQMLFMAHSKNRTNSTCDLVVSVVENCVESPKDEDKNLREYIFGIVDGDNKEKHFSPNILALRRYSIENYIYDPVHIYFCVKHKNPKLQSFIDISKLINEHCITENLKAPESFDDIFNYSNKDKSFILQTIIDCVSSKLIDFFQESINSKNPEIQNLFKKLYENERFKHLLKADNQLVKSKETVIFADGLKLDYYKLLLEMQGHDLEHLYSCLFRDIEKKTKTVDKNLILSYICKNNMLIPEELVDIFNTIQNPLQQYDYQKPTKQVKPNKSDRSPQLQKNVKDLKEQIAKKDKEIKEQHDEIKKLKEPFEKLASNSSQVDEPPKKNWGCRFL